ncbi:MAG: FHA domain-containing protein [Bacteroidaceae bacterium]|nr:FHA domain-containing protein [Bacteroidaceae bacterium]
MKIVIGRDPASGCLKASVDGGRLQVVKGTQGLSPMVSKDHLSLESEDGTHFILTNLNASNVTYVRDVPVVRYHVLFGDNIYMGTDRQQLDWGAIKKAGLIPQYVDIRPLKYVWEEYQNRQREINIERNKAQQKARLLPAFTMTGGVLGAVLPLVIPGLPDTTKGIIVAVFMLLGIIATIYFFITGNKDAEKYPIMLDQLKREFMARYVCPNPDCRTPFGNIDYAMLAARHNCQNCKSRFIT